MGAKFRKQETVSVICELEISSKRVYTILKTFFLFQIINRRDLCQMVPSPVPKLQVRPLRKQGFILALHSVFPIIGPFDAHRYHYQQNRSKSRSAGSSLKFSCFGPYVSNDDNRGLHIRVVRFVQLFENAHSHSPIEHIF